MKLSEIKQQLDKLIELHGDVHVEVPVYRADLDSTCYYKPNLLYDDRFGRRTIEFITF